MNIYLQILLLTAIVIFVVDVSGFSDTVCEVASRVLGRQVQDLRPFTCSLCMTWWCGLIWAICTGNASLPVIAFIAALSAFSRPLAELIRLLQDGLLKVVGIISKAIKI